MALLIGSRHSAGIVQLPRSQDTPRLDATEAISALHGGLGSSCSCGRTAGPAKMVSLGLDVALRPSMSTHSCWEEDATRTPQPRPYDLVSVQKRWNLRECSNSKVRALLYWQSSSNHWGSCRVRTSSSAKQPQVLWVGISSQGHQRAAIDAKMTLSVSHQEKDKRVAPPVKRDVAAVPVGCSPECRSFRVHQTADVDRRGRPIPERVHTQQHGEPKCGGRGTPGNCAGPVGLAPPRRLRGGQRKCVSPLAVSVQLPFRPTRKRHVDWFEREPLRSQAEQMGDPRLARARAIGFMPSPRLRAPL